MDKYPTAQQLTFDPVYSRLWLIQADQLAAYVADTIMVRAVAGLALGSSGEKGMNT